MAKMLSQRDFNFADIGSEFELDEVTPVYEMEHRADKNGEIITGQDGHPRNFPTDKIIGYNYSVTITSGQFRKKSTQVKALDAELAITNQEIMKVDSVKCQFENLEPSMIGNPMYYRAEKINLVNPTKKV